MARLTQNHKHNSYLVLKVLLPLLLLPAIVLAAEIAVETHWGPPTYSTPYEPGEKPANMDDDHDADATPNTERTAKIIGKFKDPEYRPSKKIIVKVTGHVNIREPNNCPANVHEHELGHDELCKYEFEKNAKRKIEKELEGFDEMVFTGVGATKKDRYKDAKAKAYAELKKRLDKAEANIFAQIKVINDEFDDLTDHGRNDDPNTTEGVKQSKENVENGTAGQHKNIKPRNTDKVKPASGIGGFGFDPNSPFGTVHWPPVPLSDANSYDGQEDAIKNRGQVDFDKMAPIGKMDNGIIEMTDTTLRITDIQDPEVVLMKAYIIDPKYRPSNDPEFASMIQGYLLIPPTPAQNINNTIGSIWLDEMQIAADTNEYLSFWFYTEDELFDEDSNWLHGEVDVPGKLVLGVGMEVFEEIDRIDDHDPATFATAWQLGGNGMLELSEINSHQSNKSMQLLVDTTAPPHFSEAIHEFIPPANFDGPDKRALEIWVDSSECPPESQDNLYIRVEDSFGGIYSYTPVGPQMFENIWLDDGSDEWVGINIDLRNLVEHGLNPASITRISIGVEDPMMLGFVGMIYIDDIRIQDSRILGSNEFDLNADGTVNLIDFVEFADNWMVNEVWP